MKRSKEILNLAIRFIAGLAASLLLVGAMGLLGDKLEGAKTTIQRASGLDPDTVVMTVNGEAITAEEYLYWVGYFGQYMSYYGITDLSTSLGEGITAADYVVMQAKNQVVNTAVLRQWCAEADITLTEEDLAAVQATKDSYGSQEAYAQQLRLLGIREALADAMLSQSYLVSHLSEAFTTAGGALRPDDSALLAAADGKMVSAKVLFIDTSALDDAGKAAAKDTMSDYRAQLSASSDRDTLFATLASQLGQSAEAGTYSSDSPALTQALLALEEDQLSELITDESGYYLAIRCPLALDSVAATLLNSEYTSRCENAKVEQVDPAFSSINPITFYTNFSTAQQALYNSMNTDASADANAAS